MISMKMNHQSAVLKTAADCVVLLPDRVAEEEKQYPVLWLCHGGSGDELEWLYHSELPEVVDTYGLAAVLVNANDSCFVDMAHGLSYGTYLGEELPEILSEMFPCLSKKREEHFISGLSNGGYGSLMLGLSYPEYFGAIGAFSAGDKADARPKPLLENGLDPRIRMFGQQDIQDTPYSLKYLAKKLAAGNRPKPLVYHACGSLDPWLDMNLLVKECFEALNCPEYHYEYHQIEGLGHEWAFWNQELRLFLKYLNNYLTII